MEAFPQCRDLTCPPFGDRVFHLFEIQFCILFSIFILAASRPGVFFYFVALDPKSPVPRSPPPFTFSNDGEIRLRLGQHSKPPLALVKSPVFVRDLIVQEGFFPHSVPLFSPLALVVLSSPISPRCFTDDSCALQNYSAPQVTFPLSSSPNPTPLSNFFKRMAFLTLFSSMDCNDNPSPRQRSPCCNLSVRIFWPGHSSVHLTFFFPGSLSPSSPAFVRFRKYTRFD